MKNADMTLPTAPETLGAGLIPGRPACVARILPFGKWDERDHVFRTRVARHYVQRVPNPRKAYTV